MKKKFTGIFMAAVMLVSCLSVSAFAADEPATLDQATKEAYYAQYVEIAAEVAKETELDISVLPIEEFEEEDWRTPEEFRAFILEMAHWKMNCTDYEPIQTRSNVSATKSTTVTADGQSFTLSVTGSFETGYISASGRQHFLGVNSITSKLSGTTGTWRQTGYDFSSLDDSRTYVVYVSGTLTVGGAVFANKLASVTFYCNAQGGVY